MRSQNPPLREALARYIVEILPELENIPCHRKEMLQEISRLVAERTTAGSTARLIFICTHNSRRSHMSQIWAQTAAHYFGVPHVETYSGGTEATAFNPRAVAALQRAGFRVDPTDETDNPVYSVHFTEEVEPMQCFSKVYDQPPNPAKDFCTVMTCSEADQACPLVVGASERIAISYDDPKEFDDSEQEAAMYDERCRQIATEMLYCFSQVDV